jgi:hypothetical protein
MGGSGRPSIWRRSAGRCRLAPPRPDGFSLPIAVVAGLLLLIGLAALGTRSTQGFLASVFQGVNREARDVAESAITDFAVTLNREENRWLLVAGNDHLDQWSSNTVHRNLCSGSFDEGEYGKYVPDTAVATSANRFVKSDSWQNLISGDSSRQFKVEDVLYRYENQAQRVEYDHETPDQNIQIRDVNGVPVLSVREVALQGGTRTLLRVTIQGRVQRNGQLSQARVTREFEVVPKCCKRSFGKHSGLGVAGSDPAWGTDPVQECPVFTEDGVGRGIIGSLHGGEPDGSNNTLDIMDEGNTLITRALCWSGNLTGSSDLTGTPNPDCLNGLQALGLASKNKPGITFVPMPFDLVLPRPRFGDAPGAGSGPDGGWIGSQSGVQNPTLLSAAYPLASVGNWVKTDSAKYWLKTFGTWIRFEAKTAESPDPVTSPSFSGCSAAHFGSCRSEPALGGAPYPRADSDIINQPFNQWPSAFPQPALTISSNTHIHLDPATLTMRRNGTTMDNCIVTKDPTAAYAVADCRFRNISSGNQTLTVDTTYAMINFHFDDASYTGEYMGGNGNTTIRRVHCNRVGYTPGSCNTVVGWNTVSRMGFQVKCDPGAGENADPNCVSKQPAYDQSELFNAYAFGSGSFNLNGRASTVGLNVYAPQASVELRGGGNANPNFMGRIWANDIYINGNVTVRTPRSLPSFCANHRCPPPAKIPLYDMIARSFSHASGF